jgi:hypothetical protein
VTERQTWQGIPLAGNRAPNAQAVKTLRVPGTHARRPDNLPGPEQPEQFWCARGTRPPTSEDPG